MTKRCYALDELPEQLVVREQAAGMLGVSGQTVLNWERAGKIKSIHLFPCFFITKDEIDRVKAAQAKYGYLPNLENAPYNKRGPRAGRPKKQP